MNDTYRNCILVTHYKCSVEKSMSVSINFITSAYKSSKRFS